jgi:hypothetical protein
MARQRLMEYEDAFYHVLAHRNRREPIVHGPDGAELFCKTLKEVCLKTGWRVHAWVRGGSTEEASPSGSTGIWVVLRELLPKLFWKNLAVPTKRHQNRNSRRQGYDGAERLTLQLLHVAMEVLGIDSLALRQTKGTYQLMLARLLHERTTVCQNWIAKKLFKGCAAHVCLQLRLFNPRGLSVADLHQWRLLSKIDD